MRFKTVFGSIVMVLLGCVGAQAADGDRWQETQQGRKFWFRVVSESDATVAYSTTGKDQPQTEDFNYLGGRVAHNGKTYTAVAVDENAFRGNVKLSAVRFDATVASIGATAFYNCPCLRLAIPTNLNCPIVRSPRPVYTTTVPLAAWPMPQGLPLQGLCSFAGIVKAAQASSPTDRHSTSCSATE